MSKIDQNNFDGKLHPTSEKDVYRGQCRCGDTMLFELQYRYTKNQIKIPVFHDYERCKSCHSKLDIDFGKQKFIILDEGIKMPEKYFPIFKKRSSGKDSIPWEIIAPHEAQAIKNHCGQTLTQLAERGGLTWEETIAVLEDRPWSVMDDYVAESCVAKIIIANTARKKITANKLILKIAELINKESIDLHIEDHGEVNFQISNKENSYKIDRSFSYSIINGELHIGDKSHPQEYSTGSYIESLLPSSPNLEVK